MRKLTLFMVSLTFVFWANVASADRVYVPTSFSYASTDYTTLFITNLCSEALTVSATWVGATTNQTSGSSYARTNYGFETPYALTQTLTAGQTWGIYTNADNIFATTTTFHQGMIWIQSSATDDPLTGAVGVAPFFVSIGSGKPSGFMTPPVRRNAVFHNDTAASQDQYQYRWNQ